MKKMRWIGLASVLAVMCCVVAFFGTASAQVTKGKSRAAKTKYLMRGIVRPNCADLGKLLKDAGPGSDKEWDAVACHASCLNEMSYTLMEDGRCPDAVWAKAAKTTLREGSAAVLAAAEKKDADAAQSAFQNLTKACAACHKAHRSN